MKLNPDCLRGLLLTAEENCTSSHSWIYSSEAAQTLYLAEYDHEEILYHINQADKSGLILNVHYYDGGNTVIVSDLSPAGHEFLANIRNDSVWKKVLNKASEASLPITYEVAKRLATNYFLD